MSDGRQLGDGGITDPDQRPETVDNPEIRPESVDDPDIRPETVGDPEIQPEAVDNPDIRPDSIDNPDIRPGSIDNPDLRAPTIGSPDIAPQPMSGGLPIVPIAIIGGLIVLAIAAFSLLGGGSPAATARPSGTGVAAPTGVGGGTEGPGGSGVISTGGPAASGITSGSGDPIATLELSGGLTATYSLDGPSGNVSPTATLIAAVWTETVDNVAEGYGELITVTMSGPVFSGTQPTSNQFVLSFGVSRIDAAGNDIFVHQWDSKAGECQVTMQTGSVISGTFECAGVTSADGITVTARGTYIA